ncbi:hypothetical protein EJ04DRAFT_218488 [Polyplosphaeria fusca]|uniref:Uncharacterized protein n=1 Tax=Polyplosphaeria fusca TaxID=682080 RepID=A0A9P4R1N8_9PLEO|nr:hypothetical protein EJ04DRAFT_218488 [Polyplosphaeria fusca]
MDPAQSLGSADDDVYLGFWINRSVGAVRGSTVTLNRRGGSILIAFLALYITMFGSSFWHLCRYFLHLYCSKDFNTDGLYHQRQALLRNLEMAYDTAVELLVASHAWRKRAQKARRRILPIALLAAIVHLAFFAAGARNFVLLARQTDW